MSPTASAPPRVPSGGGRRTILDRIRSRDPNQFVTVQPTRAQQVAAWAKRTAWKATHRSVRHGWRKRRTLAPTYAGMLVLLVGELAHVVPTGLLTALWLGLPAAGAAWWWVGGPAWKLTRSKRVRRTHQAWWLAGIGVGWLLLVLTAWRGWAPPLPGLVGIAAITFQVRWLWHRRVRPTPKIKTDGRVAIWRSIEGLANTTFTPEDLPDGRGWSAISDLSESSLVADDVVGKTKLITKKYKKTAGSVIVERTPEEYEHLVKVMVLNRNSAQEVTLYDNSWAQLIDGCVPFSVFPDGQRGWIRIFEPMSGPVHEVFSGDTRTGKSRGMNLAINQSAMTGLVFPLVADPQGGQSMPAWSGIDGKAPCVARNLDETWLMLQRLRGSMYGRSDYLARRPWKDEEGVTWRGLDYFDPRMVPELPILEATIDEAHRVLNNEDFADLIEEIILMASKTGIRLRLAVHHPTGDNLGNRMTIKNQVIGGNVIAYRTSASTTKDMLLPSWLPGPHTIPKVLPNGEHTKGMCVIDTSAPQSTRGTFSRTGFIRREHYCADIAAQRIPNLHEIDMEAFDNDFAGWRTSTTTAPQQGPARETVHLASAAGKARKSKTDEVYDLLVESEESLRTGQIAKRLSIKNLSTVTEACKRLRDRGKVFDLEDGLWAAVRSSEDSDQEKQESEKAGAA